MKTIGKTPFAKIAANVARIADALEAQRLAPVSDAELLSVIENVRECCSDEYAAAAFSAMGYIVVRKR